MMTKILVHGYCVGVFSSRRIQKRLAEELGGIGLHVGSTPHAAREAYDAGVSDPSRNSGIKSLLRPLPKLDSILRGSHAGHSEKDSSPASESTHSYHQLMRTNPHLVYNYDHHEEQIDSKRPENELLRPPEVASGNKALFQSG
jgi:hypothetical protein